MSRVHPGPLGSVLKQQQIQVRCKSVPITSLFKTFPRLSVCSPYKGPRGPLTSSVPTYSRTQRLRPPPSSQFKAFLPVVSSSQNTVSRYHVTGSSCLFLVFAQMPSSGQDGLRPHSQQKPAPPTPAPAPPFISLPASPHTVGFMCLSLTVCLPLSL